MTPHVRMPARLREYPGFWVMAAVLAAVAVGAAADAVRQGAGLRDATARCAQLRIELLSPQVRPEMAASAAAELEAIRAQVRQAKEAWPAGGGAETVGGADRLAVYAELAGLVERMRDRAAGAGVELARDEWFGFAQHARVAPADELAGTVRAQLRAVERVLTVLIGARPVRIDGVWRENPAPAGSARENDWYELPAGRSARGSGLVESRAVRVAFTGSTACLRRLLNGLAAEPALVVREVAVATERRAERDAKPKAGGGAQRRFTVGIEVVSVTGGTWAEAPTTKSATEAPPVWRAPLEGLGGEVFAMPAVEYVPDQRVWRPTAPPAPAPDEEALTVVAVRRVPYRWRLVGHVGERAGVFEETGGRRSVVLPVGRRDDESGIALESLEFVRTEDGGRLVRARLRDPQENAPVVLATAGNGGAERMVAVLRLRGRADPVSVEEGARVAVGDECFAIGRISAEPASVRVTRLGAEGAEAAGVLLRVAAK